MATVANPVTPLRPTPGNFYETPAASRVAVAQPPDFGRRTSTFAQSQPNGAALVPRSSQAVDQQAKPPSSEASMTPIQRAAKTVNDTLASDARFPDLESYIPQGHSTGYDTPLPAMVPFQRTRTFEIPDSIFEQYNNAQMHTMMGLFAEIHHAWVSIDNALYIWDYTAPNPELIGFEEQPHCINSVKLVKPRAGVFVATVSYLLVIATQNDILLIGLSAERSPAGIFSVKLYSTGMQTSVKGLDVTCIVGSSKTGRIFFGGRTSNDVFELLYKQEDTWFASRCSKVNHTNQGFASVIPALTWSAKGKPETVYRMTVDDTRNLVYTLSSHGAIRALHMSDSTSLRLAIARPLQAIKQNIGHMVQDMSSVLGQNDTIIDISPITAREASRIALVATTTSGCRLYLSTTSSLYYTTDPSAAPNSMQVHHVRYPPPQNGGQLGIKPSMGPGQAVTVRDGRHTLTASRFSPGLSFSLSTSSNTPRINDTLLITAPDTGRIAALSRTAESSTTAGQQSTNFIECMMALPLGSQGQDIGLITPPFAASNVPVGFGNELATQFDDSGTTEVALLTNTGIHVYKRRRLVDSFASLVRSNKSSEDSLKAAAQSFVQHYGHGETMACALTVCCGQNVDISADGGRVASVTEPDVVEGARKVFTSFGGRATLVENSALDATTPASIESVRPSPRHEGMALYVSRVLRSVWKSPVVKEIALPGGPVSVTSAIATQKLRDIQRDLSALKEFLDQNKAYIEGLTGSEANQRATNRQEELAMQGENRAMTSILKLIVDVVEGVAFVLVLFEDNRADAILSKLDERNRADVRTLTFEALFVSNPGKELAKALVKAIVNSNIEAGSNVETVAEALRRKCGSFCSTEDVMVFKAQEMLNRAMHAGKESEVGRSQLNDSYKLFQNIAGSLRMEVLRQAVANYITLEFWAGAVSLVLDVAQASDPANRAIGWMRDGEPKDDVRQALFYKRKECYNIIHDIILAVDASRTSGTASSLRDRRMAEAYNAIDSSEDELFLSNLYDWYLEKGWSDRLLDMSSDYVVSYLQRKSLDNVGHANMLWKYYTHHARYLEAATVQLQLAKSNFDLRLSQRVEYLSRAKANTSTRTTGLGSLRANGNLLKAGSLRGLGKASTQGKQELLKDISDLLDLANIQEELLGRLLADPRMTAERAGPMERELDGEVKSLDDLYHKYIDQASYYDLALVVYQTADYRDIANISAAWQNMLFKQTLGQAREALDEAAQNPSLPAPPLIWEAIAERVRNTAQRLQGSEAFMPPNIVVTMLATWYINDIVNNRHQIHKEDDPGLDWIPDLFLSLNPPMPYESFLPVLEQLLYSNEEPWTSPAAQRACGKWIIYTCDRWFTEGLRSTNELFGGEENAHNVVETLRGVESSGALKGDELELCAMLRTRIQSKLR